MATFSRRARLAVSSIPGRSARPGSSRPRSTSWRRRWRPILDHAEKCGVDCLLRDPSRRRSARWRDLRDVPRALEQPRARVHAVRPVALRAAVPRLPRAHRHLSRAHQDVSRQGCRVQPDRRARASTAATRAGSIAQDASARSATARSISAAIFSKFAAYDYRGLGGGRVGVRAEASRGRCARRRRVRARAHHPRHASGRSTISPAPAPTRRPTARMLGIRGVERMTIEGKPSSARRASGSAWSAAA